jgi:hypothetical protein
MLKRLGRSGDDVLEKLGRIEQDVSALRKRVEKRRFIELNDVAFVDAAREVISRKRTSLREDRLWILWQAVHNVARLGGEDAAVEIGTYRGGSAHFIASAYVHALGHEVPLEVIDTFRGLTDASRSEADGHFGAKTTFAETSHQDVSRYLSHFERTEVHEGDIADVAPTLRHRSYGFVHIDVDLYEPAVLCLRHFAPLVPAGGVIVLDDYDALKCPGIRAAAEEYLLEDPGLQPWNPHTEQLVLVRLD